MLPADRPGLLLIAALIAILAILIASTLLLTAAIRYRRRHADRRRARAQELARPRLMEALAADPDDIDTGDIEEWAQPYLETMAAGLAAKLRGGDRAGLVSLLDRRGTVAATIARTRNLSPVRRMEAVELLGGLGVETAVPEVVARIDDQDGEVARTAVRSLGRIGSTQALPALLMAVDSDDYEVPDIYLTLAMLRMGPAAVEPLEDALRVHGPGARTAAAQVLGWLGEPRALGPLTEAVQDPEPQVRAAAVGALGRLGMPEAFEAISTQLAAEQPATVRLPAIEALGRLGDDRAVLELGGLLGTDHHVNMAAAQALSALGGRGRELLADHTHLPEVREVLGILPTPADPADADLEEAVR